MSLKSAIADKAKFDAIMQEIDDELRTAEVPIPWRPMAALSLVTKRFPGSFLIMGSSEDEEMNAWFRERYGDQLKIDYSKYGGETVVPIKGDPYLVKVPFIAGRQTVNPFKWVRNVPPALWGRLSEAEIDAIAVRIMAAAASLGLINAYIPSVALPNLSSAIYGIMMMPPSPGLSRFESLQAVEKSLKHFVAGRGGNPPRGGKNAHDLGFLADQAEALGLPSIDRAKLGHVQCSPAVRYDMPVKLSDAIEAHINSIDLCGHIAPNCELPTSHN